jgi:hypothetical protein
MSNHEAGEWHGYHLEPGQFITGRDKLMKITGLTAREVRTCLTRLKTTSELSVKTTNKFSIITIIKWAEYQGIENKTTSKTTNNASHERPTNDHKQEGKEGKEERNTAPPTASPSAKVKKPNDDADPKSLEEFEEWCSKSSQPHIKVIGEWAGTIRPDCRTKGQWREFMSRHYRTAVKVSKFSREQIEAAYTKIEKARDDSKNGFLEHYTIETLYKYLTT